MNPICQICMDKFFGPYYEIFWWTDLAILTSHRNVYQNFIFNFEDIWKRKFVSYQTLIAFFHTGKLGLSWVLVETSYSDGFYVTRPKPYEVLGDLFVVNIFVIKQNILITFSPLLRIVSSSEKGTSKFICKFAKEILWVFGLILRKLCSKSKWTFSYAALRNLAYWR